MSPVRMAGAVALLLAAAIPAAAQDACSAHLKLPTVGQWAEYQMVHKQKDKTSMRYAIIGEETREGAKMHWIEMQLVPEAKKNDRMIYQVLVPGFPYEPGQIQEVVMKTGDRQAMKMSGMMLGMIRGAMNKQGFKASDLCKEATLIGGESVSVPAGTFQTQHYRSERFGGDSWISSGVAFGTVKATGKDFEMVLVAHGKGAKSAITETPQEMPGAR